MTAEWTRYRCVLPPQRFGKTVELASVYHVTHSSNAMRIIEDGMVSRGLVFDESKLNITRRTVTWVSPNTWYHGSRYGTVQMEFLWQSIVKNKAIYWVEDMNVYNPTAVRFFITDGNIDGLPPLSSYDPSVDDGPLRFNDGKWWWNCQFTLELMIDADLPLSSCSAIDFIKHHPNYCNIGHSHCSEMGKNGDISAARVISYLLTTHRSSADHAFLLEKGSLTSAAEKGLVNIGTALGGYGKEFEGPVNEIALVKSIVRGALSQLAFGRRKEGKALVAMIGSNTLFWSALQDICQDHFGVKSTLIEEGLAD